MGTAAQVIQHEHKEGTNTRAQAENAERTSS